MSSSPNGLSAPVDPSRDHILGPIDAEMTLVEYGSYTCRHCTAVHEVIEKLRNRFGDRMRYVFRHLPRRPPLGTEQDIRAIELVELAARHGRFWEVHEALMRQGPRFEPDDFKRIAEQANLPADETTDPAIAAAARARTHENVDSARRSGVRLTPTFFINGRRYSGDWDESSLAEAMLGSLGHRIQAAAFDFVRWGPSAGLLLGLATILALVLSNSPLGPAFMAFWKTTLGITWADASFTHSLLHWVNHGLLSIFFFVVGLEIKREFTIGHLSTFRSGALPVIAAMGGIVLPALIYAVIAPPALRHGWGIPIGTDTAFAVALIVLLGARVPIELRVFLTAAVIIDDIVAILVIAVFYSGDLNTAHLITGGLTAGVLAVFNRSGVYRVPPYLIGGVILWYFLHEAGLHATLAGVILAVLIPTRPPPNLNALLSQATMVLNLEIRQSGEAMRTGPSEPTMQALDAINRRIESPAEKMLRSFAPWSSYPVLPIFALANAGVAWSFDVFADHARLICAIVVGLVVGKAVGITTFAWLAVRSGVAVKPEAYTWRQLVGAGALGGIGFTMSVFIAGLAFDDPRDYDAAKIAIFIASIIAAAVGTLILLPRSEDAYDLDADNADAADNAAAAAANPPKTSRRQANAASPQRMHRDAAADRGRRAD